MKYIFFLFILFVSSCISINDDSTHFHLDCSGENISEDNFKEGSEFLSNSICRSNDFSRTGSFSFKLNKQQPYGPTYKFNSVKKGEIIYSSVWRKKGVEKGKLIIASNQNIQYESAEYVVHEEGDWEQMKCSFIANQDFESVSIYLWNPTENDIYFDDLKIDFYQNIKKPELKSEKDILRINIPSDVMEKIVSFRNKAIEQDIISEDLKSYFKASIDLNGEKHPISIRLKGDWVDHITGGDKWSYRIKIGGNKTYQGMKKFSIQNPSTRSFMSEWFAHRLFEKEDILTTRYQFKVVYINGINMGIYALEEHFDKRLLEHRKRREGPIVKFDESGVWQARKFQKKNGGLIKKYPYLESSEILPFSEKKTRKNEVLLNQFMVAKSHMERYRNQDENIEEFIDIDKMARFLALCDITNATHGLAWHNQRNYFNPVKSCLEPIAFDCFTTHKMLHDELIGKSNDNDFTIIDALFLYPKFEKIYVDYLNNFSKESFFRDFILDINSEIKHCEFLLSHEYPMHQLDVNYFLSNCNRVREKLLDYEKLPRKILNTEKIEIYKDVNQDVIFSKAALNVYTVKSTLNSSDIQFENFLLSKVEVVGYSIKKNNMIFLPNSFFLDGYGNKAKTVVKSFDFKPKEIYYKTAFTKDSLIKINVSDFSNTLSFSDKDYSLTSFQVNKDTVLLKKGDYIFNNSVFVPRDKILIIEAGSKIDLRNNARFVSYSPVLMNGTKETPINFYSSDKKGGGVVVFPENGKVSLEHVNFLDLSDGNNSNWILTGAVTVYEGEVSISNCAFSDNRCEDALNLIRCNFEMDSSLVSNTKSDGFDADFCYGSISNCNFINTGNDCVDFSGSTISISNCKIDGSGDKGISGGENSSLTINDCVIENTSIAIASKDMSDLYVSNVEISKCSYALAAYQKKAEFGPSKINIKSSNIENLKTPYLVELNSEIILEGKKIVGQKTFDIDSMYKPFK